METNNDNLQSILDEVRASQAYAIEGLHIDITEDLLERMEYLGIKQSDLAHRLECSRSYISRAFSKPKNFTLETVAKLAYALDLDVKVQFQPKDKENYSMMKSFVNLTTTSNNTVPEVSDYKPVTSDHNPSIESNPSKQDEQFALAA
jgi:transcriptional regulator with XRE-family HTH domain